MHPVPLGLYMHLPWCRNKCPYCDFNSHQQPANLAELLDNYATALLREWRQRSPLLEGREIQTIYCGGGTPNLAPPEWYARLFFELRRDAALAQNCEITLEANPGAGRNHDYLGYAQAGFNRVSLGIQSFCADTLNALGRDYTTELAVQAIEQLLVSPINNFNFDLLYATPNQHLQQLENDLTIALGYAPPHLSCYELSIEPNTLFFSHQPQHLPAAEIKNTMFLFIEDKLAQHGFEHYEVSAYATAGYASRHNCSYWEFGDYLSLGAGAHAKITLPAQQQLLRYANPKNPATYMAMQHYPAPQLQQDCLFQFCLNSFRLAQGVPLEQSALRLCTTQQQLLSSLTELLETGSLLVEEGRLRLARQAWLNQNSLLERLV